MQWNPAGPRLRQATQCLDGTCGTRSRRRQAQSLLDQAQVWRDSDDAVAVIVKYAIASIPLLLIWYFLAGGDVTRTDSARVTRRLFGGHSDGPRLGVSAIAGGQRLPDPHAPASAALSGHAGLGAGLSMLNNCIIT